MNAAFACAKGLVLVLALATAMLAAGVARADLPKRKAPDYDGRSEPTTAGDVLIWVPRVVLSPLYVVSEYVVRRPLGFLTTGAEQAHVPEILYDLFTFGPDHNMGLFPIAFIDFGFDPSVGLYFFWDDAFTRHNDVRVQASNWGDDWFAASIIDRLRLDHDTTLTWTSRAVRRPDYAFYGIGGSTRESALSRYGSGRLETNVEITRRFWRASAFSAALGVRSVSFHKGEYDEDALLEERVAAGSFALPDGYADGYTVLYDRISIALDSRRPRPASGSGLRIEAMAEQQSDVRFAPGAGYLRYSFGTAGFYDLNDHGRVVSLSARAAFTDPLGDTPVPFTELAAVGGSNSMRGFVPGRLYDRTSAVATLRYRWPVWIWLDGSIQMAVGNVFGAQLKGLSPGHLRFSSAIGVESVGSPDSSLELLLGIGSETFDQGAEIDSLRLVIGANHGF